MNRFTISRVTLFSFLLALLLAVGIRMWTDAQRDDCARYLAGDATAPASELVVMGSRTVVVSCNQWLPRQPVKVQMLCLLELVLAAVFLMNALHDLHGWLQRSRRAG